MLNTLAGENRVVVHDMDGTIRDPVDELITLDDRKWWFVDTAGIRRQSIKLLGLIITHQLEPFKLLKKRNWRWF